MFEPNSPFQKGAWALVIVLLAIILFTLAYHAGRGV